MRKAMVAIGVNRTSSDFPTLRAAAQGAVQMADWGRSQGFDVTLLSDQDGKSVTLSEVFSAVSNIVKARIYSQLVVYFSGHGILLAAETEAWLLSGALDNPNEAINVSASIIAARASGVEHVVFVSDACRSMPVDFRMGMVSPGLIFPPETPRPPGPEVDVFYATLPGDPALEVGPDEAEESFRGLLTSCMLKAFTGKPASLIEQIDDASGKRRSVVASRPLKAHLIKAVPDAASMVSIKLRQYPDVRVESALPKYLAEIANIAVTKASFGVKGYSGKRSPAAKRSPGVRPSPAAKLAPSGEDAYLSKSMAFAMSNSWKASVLNSNAFQAGGLIVPKINGIQDSIDHIVNTAGRESPRIRTGFTVHGGDLKYVRVNGAPCNVFTYRGAAQVRLFVDYPGVHRQANTSKYAALLRFSDGTGTMLAVLPGYIGSVVMEGGRIATVNYSPSRGTENYGLQERFGHELEQRRAFVAVAAKNGSFRLDAEAARGTAAYLREFKKIDPTLGLYAAYAYAQAGDKSEVLSVYRYMRREPEPVFFDVAMLAAQRDPEMVQVLDFPPWMPMLTQGWMLMEAFAEVMPEPVRKARAHLLPGLWTTFAPEGMDILEMAMFGGLNS